MSSQIHIIIIYNVGKGYRRCPGELLSMTFLEEIINIINIINLNKLKLKLKLKFK